jgi:hypothetical protein
MRSAAMKRPRAAEPRARKYRPNAPASWLFAVTASIFVWYSASIADELALRSLEPDFTRGGDSNQLLVRLVNGSPLQGLQFDLAYDPAQAMPVRVDPVGRLHEPLQLLHSISPAGVLHVLAYEKTGGRSLIDTGADPVVAITFAVSDSAAGDTLWLSIANALGADPQLAPIPIASRSAGIPLRGTPSRFALDQGFPNPFSASTRVRFDVPRPAHVRIAVHDLAGRVVRVLADEDFKPGEHAVTWDGTGTTGKRLSPGVYFYVMEANQLRLVRKTVRLR